MSNIEPALKHVKDMVAQFEAISLQMGEPGADIDALSSKMDRLQVGFFRFRLVFNDMSVSFCRFLAMHVGFLRLLQVAADFCWLLRTRLSVSCRYHVCLSVDRSVSCLSVSVGFWGPSC